MPAYRPGLRGVVVLGMYVPPGRSLPDWPHRVFWMFAGGLIMAWAILVAAGTQAGVTSSAELGGTAPTSFSLALLYLWLGVLGTGAALAGWGVSPFLPPLPGAVLSPAARGPEGKLRPSRGLFLTVTGLLLGVGLLAMGLAIPLPGFCFSHGLGPCTLAPALLTVPHVLDAAGSGIAIASGLQLSLLKLLTRRRTPQGPS